jgi:hypothetical protein
VPTRLRTRNNPTVLQPAKWGGRSVVKSKHYLDGRRSDRYGEYNMMPMRARWCGKTHRFATLEGIGGSTDASAMFRAKGTVRTTSCVLPELDRGMDA